MLRRYAVWVVGHPWITLLAASIFIGVLATGTAQLTFRSDSRVFFSKSNPELQALEAFERLYHRDDTIVFVISAQDGDLFTPERLTAVNELTDAAWYLPDAKRVDSLTNFQRVWSENGHVRIDHLARAGDKRNAEQGRNLKPVALAEPLVAGRLVDPTGAASLVAVRFQLTAETAGEAAGPITQKARALAADIEARYPDLEVGVSGSLALDSAFGEASKRDLSILTPIMLVVILVLMGAILRSLSGVGATLLVIGLSIVGALGVAGWLGVPLSSPSVAAPNIILVLATADCVHICAAAGRFVAAGHDRRDSIIEALIRTIRPVTMTSLTTAIGFFSLGFSESPPFRHLGLMSGVGAVLAWMLAVSLLPAILSLIPIRPAAGAPLTAGLCCRVYRFVAAAPRPVALTTLAVGLLLSAAAFTNHLDDRYVAYFDESFAFRRDTDTLNSHIGGFYTLEYSLDCGAPGCIAEPDYLARVDRSASWLRSQPEITHVDAISDVLGMIRLAMTESDAAVDALPRTQAEASQYLALYEMSLPVGLDLKERITVDKSQSRLTVSLRDISTEEILAVAERAQVWFETTAPKLAPSAKATGTSVMFAHIGMRNIREMLIGTFLALVLISGLLFLLFRSFFIGLVATFGNLIPPLAALGGWAIGVGEVGMAVAVIAAITLGIVVDDTIHFLEAATSARRSGSSLEDAVAHALDAAGPGIVATSVVLAAGFGCLAFSGFQINAWMGLMTAITILVALVFDLLFMPAVLLTYRRWS